MSYPSASDIERKAPQRPACFADRTQWVEYLLQSQRSRRQEERPFSGVRYQPDFNFCRDCTGDHASAMRKRGSCNPDSLRVIPIKVIPSDCLG